MVCINSCWLVALLANEEAETVDGEMEKAHFIMV